MRLNRRLAPDVYLGTARLTSEGPGRLAIDGPGETVDWLVVMRRLPDERILDRAIRAGTIGDADVEAVAALLAGFYRGLRPEAVDAPAHLARFARDLDRGQDFFAAHRFDGVAQRAASASWSPRRWRRSATRASSASRSRRRALVLQAHPASIQDRDGAVPLLTASRRGFPFVEHAFADSAYAGDRVADATRITVEIVRKHPDQVGFAVQLRRWRGRALLRLDRPQPPPRQGFRGDDRLGRRLPLRRLRHAASTPSRPRTMSFEADS